MKIRLDVRQFQAAEPDTENERSSNFVDFGTTSVFEFLDAERKEELLSATGSLRQKSTM